MTQAAHFPECLPGVRAGIALNGLKRAKSFYTVSSHRQAATEMRSGWRVLPRQEDTMTMKRLRPRSTGPHRRNQTGGIVGESLSEIETFPLCKWKRATCAGLKQEDSLSPWVRPPPHNPTQHSLHVYCVHKPTKGSSLSGCGRLSDVAVSLEKMVGFGSPAAPRTLPLWFQPDGYLRISAIT